MNNNKKFLLLSLGLATAALVSAQDTRTGYFLDEYTYRYQMNPAFGNDKGFVSMPLLGNLNLGMAGTLRTDAVLRVVDGKTTTFLNPAISAHDALSKFKNNNRLDVNLKENIISAGFNAFGGYNTISVNARFEMGAHIPKSLFSLAKEGLENKTYDITNVGAYGTAYGEIALNHSRNITPEWRVGAAVKFLIGVGNVDARFKQAKLTLGKDNWSVISNATVNASVKGLSYKQKLNETTNEYYVDGMDYDSFGLNGFGLGFDLGAVYSPKALPDWQFSIGLVDLGFISWNENAQASTNGDRYFETDKYTFNVNDDALNSFDNEWKKMRDDLEMLYQLHDNGNKGSRTTSLATTFNIGAQYTFPLYRPLTFGLMNTTRINGPYTWTDFRLSANVAPCSLFSAAASFEAGTFGVGFGWLLNLHVTGFNLFLGMDHTLGYLAKQGVPLNSNASVNLGINFLF